jgi:DinB superfamily
MHALVPTRPLSGAQAAAELRSHQRRLAAVLAALPAAGWNARLDDDARAALVATGHFPDHRGELDWNPQEVAGHLRDSARVFTSRLYRLLAADRAPLGDFDPLDADRVAGYAATPRAVLLAELVGAQARLSATVAGVPDADLARAGRRGSGATVTVAELLAFLPDHQADHAAQLEALAAAATEDRR